MDTSPSFEESRQDLNPHPEADRERAAALIAGQLYERGVRLTGDEAGDELATLLSAVERFETAVSTLGGDRMTNDLRTRDPDDKRFVLPQRRDGESARDYAARIAEAADSLTFPRE